MDLRAVGGVTERYQGIMDAGQPGQDGREIFKFDGEDLMPKFREEKARGGRAAGSRAPRAPRATRA